MDMFLFGTVLFLLANVAVVIAMVRRVNLNNESVLAWELAQSVPQLQPVPALQPVTVLPYQPVYLARAA